MTPVESAKDWSKQNGFAGWVLAVVIVVLQFASSISSVGKNDSEQVSPAMIKIMTQQAEALSKISSLLENINTNLNTAMRRQVTQDDFDELKKKVSRMAQ